MSESVYQQQKKRGRDNASPITQRKAGKVLADNRDVTQCQPNNTGLPSDLKSGMENLSGMSLDHVRVHRNSSKPAAVQAHAYAQGSDIHLASGQEKHLPHELGHVVQQMQGRVTATANVGGMAVNDNAGLESEADTLGQKAIQGANKPYSDLLAKYTTNKIVQKVTRPSRVNRRRKKKNKGNVNQNTSAGFSYFEHYTHKLPQVFDLLTSFRRQRMLITSTLTREYLHRFQQGVLTHVPTNQITLLHPNSLEDTKTKMRYNIILDYLEKTKSTVLSDSDIKKMIKSDEGIQVAKVAANRYVSMQGVGRIVAIKEAAKKNGSNVSIEIMTYDLSDMPIIPSQLEAIAASYHTDESLMSKTFGTLLGIGLPSYLLNYFSGGKLVQLASSLASYVIKQMEHDVLQVHSKSSDPFMGQYPSGGTSIDG